LRGHRRTYIGAMPGRIVQAMRRAGVNNPVLMLDEVDKVAAIFAAIRPPRFWKSSTLNRTETSATTTSTCPSIYPKFSLSPPPIRSNTIPQPLLDRMELLRLAGYSEEEKIEIAKRYLIPRQLKETGLKSEDCVITDEALKTIIAQYTREAGVRQLERAIGRIARKVAVRYAEGHTEPVTVGANDVVNWLGPRRFSREQARRQLPAGVAIGLAWTETGGEVLYVEATLLPNGRGMTLTGQLGEVMQESRPRSASYNLVDARELGIDRDRFRKYGVHIHVPAGATPKDGPSAGVTMATALASVYSGYPARADIAMTGEITLTGLVLPIGGVKEKVLAARRVSIKRVILRARMKKTSPSYPIPSSKKWSSSSPINRRRVDRGYSPLGEHFAGVSAAL